MSWLDRVENDIQITTGEGSVFIPNWVNTSFIQEYNISTFEFPNIAGTLVRKKQPKGRKFQMEIYFQGENHLEDSEKFRIAAADQRAWRVTHPLYDEIIAHPRRLLFDNKKYNLTKITGTLLETITGVFPDTETNAIEEIEERKEAIDEQIAINYETEVPTIDGSDANLINVNLNDILADTEKITFGDQVANLRNAVVSAQSAVISGIGTAEGYIRKAQSAINFPFQVINSVKARLNTFKSSLDRLRESISTILGKNGKQYYEANSSSAISASCLATVTPIDISDVQDFDTDTPDELSYTTRSQVDESVELVIQMFNDYVEKIDEVQAETSTQQNAYLPDPITLMQLQEIVNLTVSSLFEVALGSRQEHVLILEEDSDPINVAHRLFGLDDEKLETLIDINEIGLDELYLLRKGREIIYYV